MMTSHLSRWRIASACLAAFAGLFSSSVSAQTPTVTTLASGLANPSGVAVDASGNVYVGEISGQIKKITPAGVVTNFAHTGVNYPYGMTTDASGNVFVGNYGGNTVSKITPAGAVSTYATVGSTFGPIGLAVDAAGNLFVASRSPAAVFKVTPQGAVSQFATLPTHPVGMTIDPAGNLYVGYTGSFVSKITPAGVVSTYANNTGSAYGAAYVAATGDLFVGGPNGSNNAIMKVTASGVVTTYAVVGNYPWGIAADAGGALYVAVFGEGTVKKVGGTGFGVNFSAGVKNLAVAESPGIAFGGNWNNVAGGTNSNVALVDHSALATTARLAFTSTGANGGMPALATSSAATNTLYGAALWGDNTTREATFTVTGVPYSYYDVYVYTYAGGTANVLSITNGQTTYYYRNPSIGGSSALVRTMSTNPAAPTVGDAQYQVFANQTSSSFTITTGGSLSGVIANHIVGFQVVAKAAPAFPVINSPLSATGTVGSSFTYQITATNSPTSYGATGLPAGLSVNSATGAITGTPSTAGSYSITLSATNAGGTGTASLSLSIAKGSGTVTLSNLVHTYDGTVKGATATTSPGSYAVSFSYSGAALPPVNAGAYGVLASITNANYQGSASGTLTINKAPVTITLANLTQPFNGAPRAVSATTQPSGVPVTITYNGSSTAPTGIGSYAVSATSSSPNYAGTATGTLVVQDTVAPVISAPADIVLEATGPQGAVANFNATATDNVDGAVAVTGTPQSGSVFPLGTTAVSLSAQDAAGNNATASFTVTVQDTMAPVLEIPANIVMEATSPAGAVVTFNPAATDIVDGAAVVTSSIASGSVFAVGTTAVTLTAIDQAGNTVAGVFTVTVVDTQAPVIAPQDNLIVEATDATGAVVTFTPSALDIVDGGMAVAAVPASGSVFPIGTTVVTLAASDAAGNTGTSTFTVTVRDTTAPTIQTPANLVAEATSAAGAVVTYTTSASDSVDSAVVLDVSPVSGSTFPLGTTNVVLTATDAAGNTSTGSFAVTVRDTTAPVLTVPANQVVEATMGTGAVATYTASATDAVSAATVSYSVASGSTFALGTTTVTVTATDAAGNSSTGSFTITVRDTTAPVLGSVTATPNTLWSPNKKLVPVVVSAPVTDAVGATAKIVSVTTNEPDGTTQWEVTGNLTLNVKSDRKGGGSGRVYTITVEAKDAAGNAVRSTVLVSVPHDQRK